MSQVSRFTNFTDEEVYILYRQAVESSANIVLIGERYSDEQRQLHNKLLNELLVERKNRDYGGAE